VQVRRAITIVALFAGVSAAIVVGCGLDAIGTLDPGVFPLPDRATCMPAGPELCTDGIDNDCNGAVDCEDPACTGYTCIAAPAGWTPVAMTGSRGSTADGGPADAGAPACPSGWSNRRDMVDTPRPAAAACACRCGGAPGPAMSMCVTGGVRAIGLDTNSDTICGDRADLVSVDGGCHPVFPWGGGGGGGVDSIRVVSPAPTNVACAVLPTLLPRIVDDGAIIVCDPMNVAACMSGTCVERPGAFVVCLAHPGREPACPSGFGVPRVLRNASAIVDERSCAGTCACATTATACVNRSLNFYADLACSTVVPMRAAVVDDTCRGVSGAGVPVAYRYAAQPNTLACAPATATLPVDGGVTFPSETTICCPP
jgi:hypothetical protein